MLLFMQLARQETQTKALLLAKWLWLQPRCLQVSDRRHCVLAGLLPSLGLPVSVGRSLQPPVLLLSIFQCCVLCALVVNYPQEFHSLKKKKSKRRGHSSSEEQWGPLLLKHASAWEGTVYRLLPAAVQGSASGAAALIPTGRFICHQAGAWDEGKQCGKKLGELFAWSGDSQQHLPCHSSWKGLLWAGKFSLAAALTYLPASAAGKTLVPLSVAWGSFSLLSLFPLHVSAVWFYLK